MRAAPRASLPHRQLVAHGALVHVPEDAVICNADQACARQLLRRQDEPELREDEEDGLADEARPRQSPFSESTMRHSGSAKLRTERREHGHGPSGEHHVAQRRAPRHPADRVLQPEGRRRAQCAGVA